jgi:hypothetical protein
MFIKKLFSSKKIQYNFLPICEDCKFYIKNNIDSYSRCQKFTFYNGFTEEIENEYADYARKFSRLCGKEGKYYKYNTIK